MKTNHVKAKLKHGEPSYGGWLNLPNIETARLMGYAGFDWLTIDMEHGALNPLVMSHMVTAVVESGCVPLVRIPNNAPEWYKWALDAGAYGIIVPQVNTREEAERAVMNCKYPPMGGRSLGGVFATRTFGTSDRAEYFRRVNEEIMVVVQIESALAMANLDDILSVPGLDVAFVGPNDLHASLGLMPSNEGAEPEFVAATDRIIATARHYHLGIGMFCSNGEAAAARAREGFTMLSVINDAGALAAAATHNLKVARG